MNRPMRPEDFREATGCAPQALRRLEDYLSLLQRWNKRINLVSPASLADPWKRHFLDSAQLLPLMPTLSRPRRIVDLGSGAGFPGLVLAALGAGEVHLFESDQRKAAFLREASRVSNTPVVVHGVRIESATPIDCDIITARAFAPLDALLGYARPFLLAANTAQREAPRVLILKGKRHEEELTDAGKRWNMRVECFPSITDPAGTALRIELSSLGDNEP